jgi:hypothetical protein
VEGDAARGWIDNHLAFSAIHGYGLGDAIPFEKCHFHAIWG